MNALRRNARDPWWDDGTGARRTRTRKRVTSVTALILAITACGLTAAMVVRTLLPIFTGTSLG